MARTYPAFLLWLRLLLALALLPAPAAAAPQPSHEPVITIDQDDLPARDSPPPSAAPSAAPSSGRIALPTRPPGKLSLSPEANRVVALINAYRAKLGYPALKVAADLSKVA